MYFADPQRGKRRRVILKDKVIAGWHDVLREFDKAGKDLRNRSEGITSAFRSRGEADIPVIIERVRASVGRAVSHPHAIQVTAERGGRVVLEGPILKHEVDCLLKKVRAVQGVKAVTNRLEIHRDAGTLALLQGGRSRGGRPECAQSWSPVQRLTAGALAGAVFVSGFRRGGIGQLAGAIAGGALLARAVTNKDFRQVFGIRGASAVEFDKTIHILAPVDEVFEFWSKVENFPRFMPHLKEVSELGDGRSRWVAVGPAGIPLQWEAQVTHSRKNELLAWNSTQGSSVETVGNVRFTPSPEGGTYVHIRMSYCPPAGVFGHGVAWLLGADPKSEMDDCLIRMKSLLEVGKTRARGTTVWRDKLPSPTPYG
jgi:uncharacterized membrane protein